MGPELLWSAVPCASAVSSCSRLRSLLDERVVAVARIDWRERRAGEQAEPGEHAVDRRSVRSRSVERRRLVSGPRLLRTGWIRSQWRADGQARTLARSMLAHAGDIAVTATELRVTFAPVGSLHPNRGARRAVCQARRARAALPRHLAAHPLHRRGPETGHVPAGIGQEVWTHHASSRIDPRSPPCQPRRAARGRPGT